MEFPPRTSSFRGSYRSPRRDQPRVYLPQQYPHSNAPFPQSLPAGGIHQPQALAGARRFQPGFRYTSPNGGLFAGDWGAGGYVAVGSYSENNLNDICVLQARIAATAPPSFQMVAPPAGIRFPATKLAWSPFFNADAPQFISAGDTLRVWEVRDTLREVCTLSKKSPAENSVSAPITSFDWSPVSPTTIIASSIDTTCTVWDLTTQSVMTQLIAHDQEVFDVAYVRDGSANLFVSVSADGSARLFDVRALDNSTIIYESETSTPLLRIAPSPFNPNLVATFMQDSNKVILLDLRAARNPLTALEGHQAPLNCVRWVPDSRNILVSGGDDCQILAWNIMEGGIIGCYNDSRQVNNVLGSPDGQWLGSVSGRSLQAVSTRVM